MCLTKIPKTAASTIGVNWEEAAGSSLILELVVQMKVAEDQNNLLQLNGPKHIVPSCGLESDVPWDGDSALTLLGLAHFGSLSKNYGTGKPGRDWFTVLLSFSCFGFVEWMFPRKAFPPKSTPNPLILHQRQG